MEQIMSQEEIRKLQKKSLEILLVFQKFCEEQGLLFYFCGGCCIGTLRHKGFIPWDDDIDVFMPREDYERLPSLWEEHMRETKYRFCKNSKTMFLRSLLSAVSDEETTFIKERQSDLDIPHGVRLEILPLDGCPDGIRRKFQIFWALVHQIVMNQEPLISKGKLFEIPGKVLLFLLPGWKLRYKVAKFAERRMSRYAIRDCSKITELCARWQYMANEYPKEIFASAVKMEFEGHEMPVPVGYDTYLKMAFGDYMQLPPEEGQIPKHDAVEIDLEHSYKEYKGKYYCV